MNTKFLFPSKFRTFGLCLIVVPILVAVLLRIIDANSTVDVKILVKEVSQSLICLGLFFMIYSRYKDDDEMLYSIRLQITVQSLFMAIIYLILIPFMDFFVFKDEINPQSALQIIMFVLLWQNLIFHYKRYQLKKELNEELH